MQIDHAAFGILHRDPGLGLLRLAFADHDRVTVGVQHGHLPGDASPQKVFQSRQVGDGVGPHPSRGKGWAGFQLPPQGIGELGVHRDHVDSLGLPVAKRQSAFAEVHVPPRQPLQVAAPQSRQRRRQVPPIPPTLAGDRQQLREFFVRQWATNAPTVPGFVLLGDHAQRVHFCATRPNAPAVERDRDLTGKVHRPRRQPAILHGRQVALQSVGREF
ncbi:MAG: hypothetical protein AABZ53_17590 [Planctomycetota bacterium]